MFGSLVSGVLGTGLGIFQAIQGSKDKKAAERELNDYERQTLTNAYDNIQISTVGSDLMTQESQRTTANLTDATRNAGLRGVLGGIPKIQSQNNMANQEARKYLDDQVNQRQYSTAEDDIRLRNIKENRDIANISALSSQVDSGKQDMWNGIIGGFKGVSMLGNVLGSSEDKLLSGNNENSNQTSTNNTVNKSTDSYGARNSRYADFGSNFSAPPQIVSPDFFGGNDNVNNKYHYNF